MERKISRRSLLLRGLQIPIGGSVVLGLSACGPDSGEKSGNAVSTICADPATMTSAEESVRRTLRYTETSADPAKVCAGCEFFSGAKDTRECGTCAMFDGKPVNPGGHCDSWSLDS